MMPVIMKEKVTMGLKWAPLAGAPTYAISGTSTCTHKHDMHKKDMHQPC